MEVSKEHSAAALTLRGGKSHGLISGRLDLNQRPLRPVAATACTHRTQQSVPRRYHEASPRESAGFTGL